MIPPFTIDGYLPPGIHLTTIEEIETMFATNMKRKQIFQKLLILVADLKSIGCNVAYVDGSFITTKERPKDVDVCWELIDDPDFERYARNNMPILWQFGTPQQIKYMADIFPANLTEAGSKKKFLDFFQLIKYTNDPKGILKIEL
jgi:hypothetical protein